jgi:hypothetical protein
MPWGLSVSNSHHSWHSGLQTRGRKSIPSDDSGDRPVERSSAYLHCAVMTLSVAKWPFVFEKIQGIIGARKNALQSALQPNPYRPGPWNIVQRHLFLLSSHQ